MSTCLKRVVRGAVLGILTEMLGTHGLRAAPKEIPYSNPIIAGDYPDPSVIRVGREYWATATTSEWAPLFPLLHSNDLVNWGHLENVFTEPPAWSTGNYWAPEISEHEGQFYVYYVARKRDGPLSIAVAIAKAPRGPYTDHGPLVSQEAGSIDPVTALDEKGERYLIWKEDGNSRNLPTPIWAQKLSDDGASLVGEMKELFRNDAPWEGNLVEGPYVIRRKEWFYLFYSGNACCGTGCSYALGVARSKQLLGPWEKYPANPILAGNSKWKCPGHGTIVTDVKGRDFLMYHAYDAQDFVYPGRQALLDEIRWETNGWPSINQGKGPSELAPAPQSSSSFNGEHFFFDDFKIGRLAPNWQWPQEKKPGVQFRAGHLELSQAGKPIEGIASAVLAIRSTRGNYEATTLVSLQGMKSGTWAGLSAYGDQNNALGIAVGPGRAVLWRRQTGKEEIVAEEAIRSPSSIYLRMRATDAHLFEFSTSIDGRQWSGFSKDFDIKGDHLPPWDRGVRVAITAGGTDNAPARFAWFRIDRVATRQTPDGERKK